MKRLMVLITGLLILGCLSVFASCASDIDAEENQGNIPMEHGYPAKDPNAPEQPVQDPLPPESCGCG
ncbi:MULTISPECIES: hypothetical protein [Dehalococcoides]|jgi:hypothetical protein|uniref:hypothetical protein n=1 Tax=Dehalococcoides TaxID=61434 RepID=UPI0007841328|nr:hypothetical protein [Dehalococcoides mccartyi]PKH45629.1 hypothetical protein KKB3_00985 [Dehalococcoides mccartyi]